MVEGSMDGSRTSRWGLGQGGTPSSNTTLPEVSAPWRGDIGSVAGHDKGAILRPLDNPQPQYDSTEELDV
ncbi:MAG: hypothetical protein M1815_000234 [Lichina confinis]|nr:MAG: hypothetical protein M1815_000234 [Lichina confinis]